MLASQRDPEDVPILHGPACYYGTVTLSYSLCMHCRYLLPASVHEICSVQGQADCLAKEGPASDIRCSAALIWPLEQVLAHEPCHTRKSDTRRAKVY